MRYDNQVIYGEINKKEFTFDGWTYYRTSTGKPKRRNSVVIESVKEEIFIGLKSKFEKIFDCKVDC